MNDADLTEIENRTPALPAAPIGPHTQAIADVHALVAEVRRLRELVPMSADGVFIGANQRMWVKPAINHLPYWVDVTSVTHYFEDDDLFPIMVSGTDQWHNSEEYEPRCLYSTKEAAEAAKEKP